MVGLPLRVRWVSATGALHSSEMVQMILRQPLPAQVVLEEERSLKERLSLRLHSAWEEDQKKRGLEDWIKAEIDG